MMKMSLTVLAGLIVCLLGCSPNAANTQKAKSDKISVIVDTDANNEVDDQHALAYLFFNGQVFHVKGTTVNATRNGGDIDEQTAEAERILKLTNLHEKVPVFKGANEGFAQIANEVNNTSFDGSDAVHFIIEEAKQAPSSTPITILALGKLTNVALALKKEPSIAKKMRVVWLGSNYPAPGEYNQDNDTAAVNFVLRTPVPFEMVTVRYGKPSGTTAVKATFEEIKQRMPGKGPTVSTPVIGRHGEAFTNFGDYSVNLFEHAKMHGDPPSRSLFDMAAIAIVKNPAWATASKIPAPVLINNKWVDQPQNSRTITLWENFDKDSIMADFYHTMENYELVEPVSKSDRRVR